LILLIELEEAKVPLPFQFELDVHQEGSAHPN